MTDADHAGQVRFGGLLPVEPAQICDLSAHMTNGDPQARAEAGHDSLDRPGVPVHVLMGIKVCRVCGPIISALPV